MPDYPASREQIIAAAPRTLPYQPLPFYSTPVPAGFPSPAEEHLGETLDLNQFLVRRPAATFFVRVRGDSMIDAGIHDDDVLVVDRSITPTNGQIAVAVLDGELTVKTLRFGDAGVRLLPANIHYRPIQVGAEQTFEVWGVVVGVVRSLRA